MDRDDQDRRSIFNRPDPELDAAGAGVESGRWAEARKSDALGPDPTIEEQLAPRPDPLLYRGSPRRPSNGPSRGMIVGGAAAGIALLAVAGFVAASFLGNPDPTLVVDSGAPSPSSSASPAASATPEESPDASPTPTPEPVVAVPLIGGQWATVTTNVVNVRGGAGLDAQNLGSASRGEIVFILDAPSQQADGLTWYQAVVSPGVAGWMAGHGEVDQHLTPDDPTTSVRWCAVPDGAVFALNDRGQAARGDEAMIGGLPISTDLLGASGSGIVELAWGTQDEMCLDLVIDEGATASVHLSVELSGCAHPFGGVPAMAVFGTGAVGPGGVTDSRTIVLDNSVLGYDPFTAGTRPNLADVISMAAVGNVGEERGEVCFTGSASGAATSPRIELTGATTQCAWLSSLTATGATLHHPDDWWVAELRLTASSHIGSGVTPQNNRFNALQGFRISAGAGLDGDAGLSVRNVPGCDG